DECVPALHPPLRLEHPRAAQRREELLEELQRDVAATRELGDRDRPTTRQRAEPRQLRERLDRVPGLRSDRDQAVTIGCRGTSLVSAPTAQAKTSASRLASLLLPPLVVMAMIFFLSAQQSDPHHGLFELLL